MCLCVSSVRWPPTHATRPSAIGQPSQPRPKLSAQPPRQWTTSRSPKAGCCPQPDWASQPLVPRPHARGNRQSERWSPTNAHCGRHNHSERWLSTTALSPEVINPLAPVLAKDSSPSPQWPHRLRPGRSPYTAPPGEPEQRVQGPGPPWTQAPEAESVQLGIQP